MKLELEDLEGETYNERIPKYPSARIRNKCEALFNAKITATGAGQEGQGQVDNAIEAISEQKNVITDWLNENYFDSDLGSDRIAPPSQDRIMREYAQYIKGVEVEKKSQDQTTKESETE